MIRFSLVVPTFLFTLSTLVLAPAAQALDSASKPYYDKLFADGTFNVTVALSYEQIKSGVKTPVLKDVADAISALRRDTDNTMNDIAAIETMLLRFPGCPYAPQSQVNGKRVYTGKFEYAGREITTRLRFIFSEPGSSIAFLKNEFIDALKNDSLIIYLGHSRHGDGFPDFAAPISDTGKIFRNDPVQGWIGFDKGYFSKTKYQILMLSSCQTDRYYLDILRSRIWEKSPSMLGLILSTDDTWFDDYPSTAAALVGGLVNQFGRDDLLSSLNEAANYYNSLHAQDPDPKGQFMFDGVFDSTYDGKPPGKRISPNEPWHQMPF